MLFLCIMSTQKGNAVRTRSQKYQNKTKFKNNLHDTSHGTKLINSLEIVNVCKRCKDIIEWKIKYKKYKPLKSPGTCVKCHNKSVKQAYHKMCMSCAEENKCCPKCGQVKELVELASAANIEKLLKSSKVEEAMKGLSERRRRTFYRQINSENCDLSTEIDILERLKELSLDRRKNPDEFDDDDDDDDDDFFNDSDSALCYS